MARMIDLVATVRIPIGLRAAPKPEIYDEARRRELRSPRLGPQSLIAQCEKLEAELGLDQQRLPRNDRTVLDAFPEPMSSVRALAAIASPALAQSSAQRSHPAGPQRDGEPAQDSVSRQLRQSLIRAGLLVLTTRFAGEARKLLHEQQRILSLMARDRSWAFTHLHKAFAAMRSAAIVLKLGNFAQVAARGEVLVCLLSQEILRYQPLHLEILEDTVYLLEGIVQRIERDGHDRHCFSTARTALCLYAAAEPTTQQYEPAATS